MARLFVLPEHLCSKKVTAFGRLQTCVKKLFQIKALPPAPRRLIQIWANSLKPNVCGVAHTRSSAGAKIPAQVLRTVATVNTATP